MPPSSSSRNAPFQPPGRWPVCGGEEWGLQLSRSPGSLRPQSADWVPFCFRQHHPPPHPPPHACCPCRPNAGSTSVTLPSSRCQGSRTHNLGCSSAPSTSLLPSLPFLSLPPPFLPSSFPPPPYLLSSLPLLSLSFPSPSSPLSLPLPPSVSSHSAFSQHPPPAPTHRAQAHHPLPLVCPWPCTSHLVTNPITDVRPRSPSARTQAQGPLRLVLTAHGG